LKSKIVSTKTSYSFGPVPRSWDARDVTALSNLFLGKIGWIWATLVGFGKN